jgi:hypothetical protein
MKIAVCGCSFSAISTIPEYKETHWSEILANKLDAKLISYARQGIGNNVIRLQIDEAIKDKADWVFIASTTEDRIEFPIEKFIKIKDEDNSPNHAAKKENRNGYRWEDGIKNFNYGNVHSYRMIAETMFSVIENYDHNYRIAKVDKNTRKAVESYAAFLYDAHWKRQVDNWVLFSGIWKLDSLKIPFLFNPWNTHIENKDWIADFPLEFINKYFAPPSFALGAFCGSHPIDYKCDPGYHTHPDGQVAIAELYYNFVKERQ